MEPKFKTPKGTELPISLLPQRKKDKRSGQWVDLDPAPYLAVPYRIVWFREEHPKGQIKTTLIQSDSEIALVYAEIRDGEHNLLATAHKLESKGNFFDYIEKAETGAIGRALGMCGYGTQFTPDFNEGERLADSPVEQPKRVANNLGLSKEPTIKITQPKIAPLTESKKETLPMPGEFPDF